MSTVKHKIFLSATPVKNSAVEYFPALNLLKPEMFPSLKQYTDTYVDWYWSGRTLKPAGLRYPEEFKERTKDFIIRRTRKEVLPDLPLVTKDYNYYEMGKEIQKAYDQGVEKLKDFLLTNKDNTNSNEFRVELQGHMMILYHITGLAKVAPILDYVEGWLNSSDDGNGDGKLAIFHHHIDVGDLLEKKFLELGIPSVRIKSTMSVDKREEILDRFRNEKDVRIFLGPTLACGEGIDLEFCSYAIQAEREWNPANEEQVEGRFVRATPESIEKAAKGLLKITMMIPVAVGTIDEFFAELIERKRQAVTQTLDGVQGTSWNQSEIMVELAKIAIKRLTANV
jgi:SNF2 family DNA or RNA helicase